jgi:hypothetical protein
MRKNLFDDNGMLIPPSKRLNIKTTPIININTGRVIDKMEEQKRKPVYRVLITPTARYEAQLADEVEADGHDWQQVATDILDNYEYIIYVKSYDRETAEKKALETAKANWMFPYDTPELYRIYTIPLNNPPQFRGDIKVLTSSEKRNEWKWLD